MNKTVEAFEKVEALLAKPEAWAKGQYARDRNGYECSATNDKAVCWCIEGAAMRVHSHASVIPLMDGVGESRGYDGVVDFNDDPKTTHADILAFLAECKEQALRENKPQQQP